MTSRICLAQNPAADAPLARDPFALLVSARGAEPPRSPR